MSLNWTINKINELKLKIKSTKEWNQLNQEIFHKRERLTNQCECNRCWKMSWKEVKKILNKLLKILNNQMNRQRFFNHKFKKNYKEFCETYKNVYMKSTQS